MMMVDVAPERRAERDDADAWGKAGTINRNEIHHNHVYSTHEDTHNTALQMVQDRTLMDITVLPM